MLRQTNGDPFSNWNIVIASNMNKVTPTLTVVSLE
jgi:hypothetical protein